MRLQRISVLLSLSLSFFALSLASVVVRAKNASSKSEVKSVCTSHEEIKRIGYSVKERLGKQGMGDGVANCFRSKLEDIWQRSTAFDVNVVINGKIVQDGCFDRQTISYEIGDGLSQCIGEADENWNRQSQNGGNRGNDERTNVRLLFSPYKHYGCTSGKHACCSLGHSWIEGAIGNCLNGRCGCHTCGYCEGIARY